MFPQPIAYYYICGSISQYPFNFSSSTSYFMFNEKAEQQELKMILKITTEALFQ
jgi:hypothetical protein